MMKIQPRPLLFQLALCASLGNACGPVFLPHDGGSGSTVLGEVEPNDLPWETQVFDPLEVGQVLDLVGSVQAAPGFDLTDHLGFIAAGPMEVFVTLEGDYGPHDFDLAVWDPTTGEYAIAWETGQAVETALFEVHEGGPFQLAVYAPFEDGDWFLRVECYPLVGASPDVGQEATAPVRSLELGPEEQKGPAPFEKRHGPADTLPSRAAAPRIHASPLSYPRPAMPWGLRGR